MEYGFDFIISPINTKDFFQNYYEKKPLVIKRNDPDYYSPVLTLADINNLLSNADLIYPNLLLVKESASVPHTEYTYNLVSNNKPPSDGIVEKEKLFHLFSQGNTIIINSLDRHNSNVHYLSSLFEQVFFAKTQPNVYLTPFNSQGFEPHWDTHDVFILQISGSKNWKLYDSEIELPSKKQSFEGSWVKTNPTHEFTLEQGDLLYIPRGFIHEGNATEKISLHITLGVHTYKYSDLLKEILKDIDNELFFRKSLPTNFIINQQEFKEQAIKYLNNTNSQKSLADIKDNFISKRLVDATNRLTDYINLNSITINSTLKRRESILFEITTSEEQIVLRFYNKSIKLPLVAKNSIDFIMDNSFFKVSGLDTEIDDEGKLNLCKKLIEEGFLSIVNL